MRRRNVTGYRVAYYRSEQGMSQDTLTARLQCEGMDITRDVLANKESGRTEITDEDLKYFHRALQVPITWLFPHDVQKNDEKFARGWPARKLKAKRRNGKS